MPLHSSLGDKSETPSQEKEKNINDLMELQNTAQELREAYTSVNSEINKAEERISEIQDQLTE